jgi:two-component system, NtrC family, C4-dicarboxylate transport sensor histidine kinase DctB
VTGRSDLALLRAERDATPADGWIETGRLAELGLLTAELLHEVRQPVFAIKALAQMLETNADAAAQEKLRTLLGQVDVLERVIDRYAGNGRPASALVTLMALGPAVESGALLLKHRADSRGIAITVEIVDGGGVVRGEQAAIQQVTTNLVQNAIDAAATKVVVRAERGVLTVIDDGPGVDDRLRPRLFEPFVTTKPPGKGTGLGLAVSRHLMRALGGDLTYADAATASVDGTRFAATFVTGR